MTLLELFGLLKKKLALVVALPLILAVCTAVYSYAFMPDQYTATTSLYILSQSGTNGSTSSSNTTSSDLSASQMLTNDFATLAKSDKIQNRTANSLGMTNLNGYTIKVTSSTTTRVIELSVTGASPSAVMTIANQMASELSNTAVEVMNLQSVNVIDDAQQPTSPSGPNRPLYILVALLAGLFLAIAIVVIEDMVDTTFKNTNDVEETLDIPVLAAMPKVRGK